MGTINNIIEPGAKRRATEKPRISLEFFWESTIDSKQKLTCLEAFIRPALRSGLNSVVGTHSSLRSLWAKISRPARLRLSGLSKKDIFG